MGKTISGAIVSKWFTEKNIFYGVLTISILLLLTVKFYPSMDGPCHLYNSNIICHLLKGDSSAISNYFTLNKEAIPNWTCYIILSLFNLLLPAWVAEKILMILYFAGLAISFRLLIKQLNPQNPSLSILIIPFSYTFLFHLGFYNYSLSFIFLFLTLFYWLKNYGTESLLKYVWLFVLLSLTYLSAILTFFFLGFCLGLFIIAFSIREYYNGNHSLSIIKKTAGELAFLLIASLPCLLASAIFLKSITFFPSEEQYSTGELIKWINDVRCLIVYNYVGEEKLTAQFLHIAIAVVSISLFIRFYNKGKMSVINIFQKSDILIIPALLTLLLFFIVPNGANAGMMSDRYCLLIYMFIITWVSSQPLPKSISKIFVVLIIIIHAGLLFKHQNEAVIGLNKNAVTIYNASEHIEKNSIVLPVNMSDNWLQPHFSNYLGVDRPMIILENYEASVGWFPVKWNREKLPCIKLGNYDTINGIRWESNTKSDQTIQIDYLFLYGSTDKINDPNWAELKTELVNNFRIVFNSENNYVVIYKRI